MRYDIEQIAMNLPYYWVANDAVNVSATGSLKMEGFVVSSIGTLTLCSILASSDGDVDDEEKKTEMQLCPFIPPHAFSDSRVFLRWRLRALTKFLPGDFATWLDAV